MRGDAGDVDHPSAKSRAWVAVLVLFVLLGQISRQREIEGRMVGLEPVGILLSQGSQGRNLNAQK